MLVVGRVVDSRRQDHDRRVVAAGGRDRAQDREQVVGIVLDRAHVVLVEQEWEDLLHDLAILEHVADAGGRASVVLEHQEPAVRVADQVDAGDVDVDVVRDVQPDAVAPVSGGAEDEFGGNDAVLEDQAIVVDVVNKEVERPDTLFEPAFDPVPFGGGDQPGDGVEGDDALDALLAAVDRERDALLAHRQVC